MKILCFSDLHCRDFGSYPPFNRIEENGLSKELNNILLGGKFVEEQILEHKPDIVFMLGDLFHTPDSLTATTIYAGNLLINGILDVCNSMSIKLRMIPGNHDVYNEKLKINHLSMFEGKRLIVHNEDECIRFPSGEAIGIVQFRTNEGEAQLAINNMVEQKPDLILTHLDFGGAKYETGIRSRSLLNPDVGVTVISGDLHCFSEDTQLLTNNGWKDYRNITFYDKAATFNLNTGEIEYQKINSRIIKKHKGKLINIKTNSTDQLLTQEHRVVFKKPKSLNWEINTAAEFNGNNLKMPISAVLNRNGFVGISDSEIKLLVWIVADGSTHDGDVRFELKKQNKIARIKEVLKENNIDFVKGKENQKGTFRITCQKNKSLNKVLDLLSQSRIKQLPWQVTKFDKHQAKILLDEYSNTDGIKYTNSMQLVTHKEEEANLIQEMCAVNGMSCNIGIKMVDRKRYWRMNIVQDKNTTVFSKRKSIKKEVDYDGEVWCVNVDNSTLMVRRNGKVFISGNCKHSVQDVNYIGSLVQNRFNRPNLVGVGGVIVYDLGTKELISVPNNKSRHYVKVEDMRKVEPEWRDHVVLQVRCPELSEADLEFLGGWEYVYVPQYVKTEENLEPHLVPVQYTPKDLLRKHIESVKPQALEVFNQLMKEEAVNV